MLLYFYTSNGPSLSQSCLDNHYLNYTLKNKHTIYLSISFLNISECAEDEYRCRTNVCIPSAYRCDYISDCDDGSDETVDCKLLVGQCLVFIYLHSYSVH